MLLAKARLKHLHTDNKKRYIDNYHKKVCKMRPPRSNIQICHRRIHPLRHNIHPLCRNIHPFCRTSPQLYTGMLQPAVAGYIRYTGISLGAVRTLVWSSFLVSDILSTRTF